MYLVQIYLLGNEKTTYWWQHFCFQPTRISTYPPGTSVALELYRLYRVELCTATPLPPRACPPIRSPIDGDGLASRSYQASAQSTFHYCGAVATTTNHGWCQRSVHTTWLTNTIYIRTASGTRYCFGIGEPKTLREGNLAGCIARLLEYRLLRAYITPFLPMTQKLYTLRGWSHLSANYDTVNKKSNGREENKPT